MIGTAAVSPWIVLLVSFVLSAGAVDLVRRHALRRRLLDIPNERSSHSTPTARGGGLGVIIVISGAWLAIIATAEAIARPELLWTVGAMIAVATVGWLDDRAGLGVVPRLAVHALAGLAVAVLSVRLGWPWWIGIAWLLWTVSSINVVNFMDGIDGLIASQTVIATLFMAWLAPPTGIARPFALAVAGAAAGFLLWNWPPARIFLGDVGSGALGFALVVTGALAIAEAETDVVRVFLPLFPLFLDASWTIVQRARRGERLTTAHRSHLYQRLANGGWGHGRVTTLYGAAAIAGALVASVPGPAARWPSIVAYGVVVLIVAHRLDRLAGPSAGPRTAPTAAA